MAILDLKKYDRQIRHFGKDVQLKLGSITVSIQSSDSNSLIGGEILKNLALLGVNKLYYDENTYKSYKKLVPNEIQQINTNIEICKLDKYDCIFLIYKCSDKITIDNGFYVCTEHYTFKKYSSPCSENESVNDIVNDCLLGAIVVQEFVKSLQGKSVLDYFKLDI